MKIILAYLAIMRTSLVPAIRFVSISRFGRLARIVIGAGIPRSKNLNFTRTKRGIDLVAGHWVLQILPTALRGPLQVTLKM